MSNRAIAILVLSAGAAAAQIAVPRIGCFVDGGRRLRQVFGVAGNFLAGEPEAEQVVTAACSDALTVIKREDSLEIRTREGITERPAPAGPALFGLSTDGAQALVFFPASGQWLSVSGRFVRPLDAPPLPEGEVVAISTPGRPDAIVRKNGEPAGPALLLPGGGRILARGPEVALTNATGEERAIALPGPAEGLEWLGPGWVRIRLAEGEGHLALSLEREQLYRLPEVAE
jgi:hypothetical protein